MNTCVGASLEFSMKHAGTIVGMIIVTTILLDHIQWPPDNELTPIQQRGKRTYEEIKQQLTHLERR